MNIEDRLKNLESLVLREEAKKEVTGEERLKLQLRKEEKQGDSTLLLQVVEVFKMLGGETQESLLANLERFVSFGLQYVFGEGYKFVPSYDSSGKDVAVDFYVQTGDVCGRVADAKGGGVAEVVSMLIQVFFMRVLQDEFQPVLILDTPMVNISKRYHGKVSALLRQLSDKLGMQIILITNTESFTEYADKAYEFTQVNGETKVEAK
jgi:hypothetical protein